MNTIKRLLIFVSILPFLLSCEEFLEQPPLDKIGQVSYWKTAIDLENYIIKYYAKFPTSAGDVFTIPYYYETFSDNLTRGQTPQPILDGNVQPNTGTWTSQWNDIRGINIFFDNYRKCEDPFVDYKHTLGEAYFFKAWFYFQLVEKYGDVPWYSTTISPNNEELLFKPRDPRTLVVDSILMHLDKAFELLDSHAESAHGNNGLTKEAALAFKTRVALYEGTWQKYHNGTPFATPGANPKKYFSECVKAAEELMNGNYRVGIYNTGDPESDFHNLFILGNHSATKEVLFYRAYSLSAGITTQVNRYATIEPQNYGVTWELVSSYLGKDGLPYDYLGLASIAKGNDFLTTIGNDIDPRLQAIIWIPGQVVFESPEYIFEKPMLEQSPTGFQPRMYARSDIIANVPDDSGFIIFRYGEVLLNYAEAKYELDGTVAYQQLNMLRSRAGMPEFTVNTQSSDPGLVDYGYTISDELYEIRRERRVETALQTLRKQDWMRWAAHSLFKGKRFKGYPFKESEFPNYPAVLDENGLLDFQKSQLPNGLGFRPGQDYLESIPQTEIILNPNLTQNPGW
jgi:hypothetical protein